AVQTRQEQAASHGQARVCANQEVVMSWRALGVAGVAGVVLVAAAFAAGGWAVITVEELPDALTAGEPVDLAFTILQHGFEPMSDRRPVVEWRQGATRERVAARREGREGRYVARIVAPGPGDWSV